MFNDGEAALPAGMTGADSAAAAGAGARSLALILP